MTRPALTLPGDIPGLLRRGSPVVVLAGRHAGRSAAAVCAYDDGSVDLGIDDIEAAHVERYEAAEVALDITDPTGRAHAAWWLEVATRRVPDHMATLCGPLVLDLDAREWTRAHLRDLNPDDPCTLPDGSRWVDAEALRRFVLHVAGREVSGA